MAVTYESSGVKYDELDAFKRACQRAARGTASALAAHGYSEPATTRGESAYLLEAKDHFLAHVEEGLGTKNLVADAMAAATGRCFYHAIGIDVVATIVNDLITAGALPISVAMHAAVGDSSWFANTERAEALAAGFAEGCRQAAAVWGGGETPALKGIVEPSAIVLAGSAVGRVQPKSNRIEGDVREGDAIVFLASSGVQTNGLTLCRAIAARLPHGYLETLPDGTTFGEALLQPSVIYVSFVRECQARGIPLHYAAHVTGHGFRKLMRLEAPFVYALDRVRKPLPVFDFMMQSGPIDLREAYATFNMGVGFAAFVSEADAGATLEAAHAHGYSAWIAGHVERQGERKAVELRELGISFEANTLNLR